MEFQVNNFKTLNEQKQDLTKKLSSIPTTSGIYRLYFPCGKSYIGSAANLRQRIRTHLNTIYLVLRYEPDLDFYIASHKVPNWCGEAFRDLTNYELGEVVIRYREIEDKVERDLAAKDLIREGKNLYNR